MFSESLACERKPDVRLVERPVGEAPSPRVWDWVPPSGIPSTEIRTPPFWITRDTLFLEAANGIYVIDFAVRERRIAGVLFRAAC